MRIARTVATISAVLVSALWVTVSLQAQVLGVKTMTALIGPTEIPGVTIVANQPITMTAHVDPSFVHTGTVELTDDFNLHTSQAAVDSNGNATFTVYPWGNAITFKAHYDGTTIYFPSDSPSVTVNVAKASTRT